MNYDSTITKDAYKFCDFSKDRFVVRSVGDTVNLTAKRLKD